MAGTAAKGGKNYLFDLNSLPGYGPYNSYTIPPEELSDERFARMIREAEKYLGYVDSFGFKEVPEFFQTKAEEKARDKLTDRPAARDTGDTKRTSVLSRLQEKKNEAAKINQQRQKPEKSKGLDR